MSVQPVGGVIVFAPLALSEATMTSLALRPAGLGTTYVFVPVPVDVALSVTLAGATYVKQPVHVPLCASVLVTTTFTAPAACDVVVPVMLVALMVDTVRAEPPNETVAPAWKSVPVIVTAVPPALAPLFGVTELTVGAGARYVKQAMQVPLCVSGFVTVTVTAPAACAVVLPVMLVALIVETMSADPPKDTVAPATKPVPANVTAVPPALAPLLGVTELTVGAATYVKQPVHVPLCASGFVTVTLAAPAACAVVVPLMLVPVTLETVTGEPPSEAVAPAWNPVPVMVTDVPPTAGP